MIFQRAIFLIILLIISSIWSQTSSILISWNPNTEPDMFRYDLYQSQGGLNNFQLLSSLFHPTIQYLDNNNIQKGILYSYYISAIDSNGNTSEFSDTVSVGIPIINWNINQIQNHDTTYVSLSDVISDPDNSVNELELILSNLNHLSINRNGLYLEISASPLNYNGPASFFMRVRDSLNFYDEQNILLTITNDTTQLFSMNIPPIFFNEDEYFTLWLDTCISSSPVPPSDITWEILELNHLNVSYNQNTRIVTFSTIEENWYGQDTIIFQATLPDQTNERDTTTAYVIPVNDPPSAFNLLEPENGENLSSIINPINFKWNSSEDVDNDLLYYTLRLFGGLIDTTINNLLDTLYLFNPSGVIAYNTTYYWNVWVNDGMYQTISDTFYFETPIHSSLKGINTEEIPKNYILYQNYPNPFNPNSYIKFGLPRPSQVKIDLYNTLGQKVESLLNKNLRAGHHFIMLEGHSLVSGIYFYKMEANNFISVRKLIVIK
jgi:hypothetical protein